jgi:hypothetical protein
MPLRQTYANMMNDPLTASVSNNTFTGPQNLIKAGATYAAQPCNIPVNYLKAGTTIRTEAFGTFSTTATPTLVFGVYFGATALAVNVALTTASGAATLPWHLRLVSQVRSTVNPAAIPIVTHGELVYGTTVSATTQIPIPGVALATTNVDNTVAAEWSVQATWSASSASNIVVLQGLVIEEVTQV